MTFPPVCRHRHPSLSLRLTYLNSSARATRRCWMNIHLSSNPCDYELLLLLLLLTISDRRLDGRFILLLLSSLHCSCYITDDNDEEEEGATIMTPKLNIANLRV